MICDVIAPAVAGLKQLPIGTVRLRGQENAVQPSGRAQASYVHWPSTIVEQIGQSTGQAHWPDGADDGTKSTQMQRPPFRAQNLLAQVTLSSASLQPDSSRAAIGAPLDAPHPNAVALHGRFVVGSVTSVQSDGLSILSQMVSGVQVPFTLQCCPTAQEAWPNW